MYLDTMPNTGPATITRQTHCIPLPSMCPVSGNPQPGSQITIAYTPAACFLEVYSVASYLDRYIGGWRRDGIIIRDMEQTIQTIASDCARALGVAVDVSADLVLDSQTMTICASASWPE